MRKIVALISGLALTGCVNSAYQDKEIQIIEEPTGSVISLDQPVLQEQIPAATNPVVLNNDIPQPQITTTPGTNVIKIPAQKIYITDTGVVLPESAQIPAPMAEIPSMPIEIQQPVVPAYQPQEVMITLQSQTYPVQYLQCSSFDGACINAAITQGYLPLQYAPQFAGFQNVLGPADYPAGGRWQNSNDIPRW